MRTGVVHRQRLAAIALAFVAGACTAVPPPLGPEAQPAARAAADVVRLQLTRDGTDVTRLDAIAEGVLATTPVTNTGTNSRWVFHPPTAPDASDAGACATATHSGLPVQEGIALRVTNAAGRTRAITVTKNVWGGASWIYNVHVWDTADDVPLRQIGAFDMSAALPRVSTDPTAVPRLCARAVGDRVELKVWPATESEPRWGDPVSTRRLTVDPEWVHAGAAGWYVGHLPPGGWAELTDLTTWVEQTLPVPTTTAPTTSAPAPTTTVPTTTVPDTSDTETNGSEWLVAGSQASGSARPVLHTTASD